jgi:CHAD domain-containing protein
VTLPDYLLDLPAEEAARLIVLALLDRAAEAGRRVADPTDPMGLHDFRVAVRRLRSGIQAFRPEIDASLSRGVRRRLARLARATGRSRDVEVHLAWERAQETHLTPGRSPAFAGTSTGSRPGAGGPTDAWAG